MAEKQQASPLILLAIYGTVKFFYEDKTHSPASYAHTTHTGLKMMPSSHALYFIVSQVNGIQLKDF